MLLTGLESIPTVGIIEQINNFVTTLKSASVIFFKKIAQLLLYSNHFSLVPGSKFDPNVLS